MEQGMPSRICAYDVHQLRNQYQCQHDLLVIEEFLPREWMNQHFLPSLAQCAPFIHRVNVRGFKKSGSVSYHCIRQHAPSLLQLYRSEPMKKFLEDIVGVSLCHCPETDPHAAALYYYTEPGDCIRLHYDKSFYKGKRFTVLLGLIQDSEHSKLVCYPGARKKHFKKNPVTIATHPGTLVVFNGDTLWHEVTPLGENEKRVILTMEYVTDTRISLFSKWISDSKDRFLYFGKKEYSQESSA